MTALSPEQIRGFADDLRREGFSVVPDVLSVKQVEELTHSVDAIDLRPEVRRRRSTYGVRNLLEICQPVVELASSMPLRSLARAVLGENAFAVRAIYFDKVPGANWSLGWHQDSVISVREQRDVPGFIAWSRKANVLQVQPPASILSRMLALRVHLHDCRADNGALRVLPGSHASGEWLDDEIDDWKKRVPEHICEATAGSVVGMRPLLLHASSEAVQPSRRGVIHIEYAAADLPGGLEWNRRC